MGLVHRTYSNDQGLGNGSTKSNGNGRYKQKTQASSTEKTSARKSKVKRVAVSSVLVVLGCGMLWILFQTQSVHTTVLERIEDPVLLEDHPISIIPPAHHAHGHNNATRFAYAFFLGAIPTLHNKTERQHAGYKGLLYNILVSVHNLRSSGSQADMVLMIHTVEPYDHLPKEDYQMIRDMNITIYYVPPSDINSFASLALEKFRILEWIQYTRVMYLNADIMPQCNLDYLFQLSSGPLPQKGNETSSNLRLEENVVVSVGDQPVSTSIFILKPHRQYYRRFLRILQDAYPDGNQDFDKEQGWGRNFDLNNDEWLSVRQFHLEKRKKRTLWSFHGAHTEAGLLYFWVRFVRKRVSIIIENAIYSQRGGSSTAMDIENNWLGNHSCLPAHEEHTGGRGAQEYAETDMKKLASPFGLAPYRDIVQWDYHPHAPWHYSKAPHPQLNVTNARQYWFQVLRELDQQHGWNLGLYVPSTQQKLEATTTEDDMRESIHTTPDWRYSPHHEVSWNETMYPIWSSKLQALQRWSALQNDDKVKEQEWQPPYLTESVLMPLQAADAHRQQLLENHDTTISPITEQPSAGIIPCECSTSITVDPCSSPALKFEDWVKDRIGTKFSKHTPACPDAARHQIHILLPFAINEEDDNPQQTIHDAYCSVQCQDYPTDKFTIYVYQDGSIDDKSQQKPVLPQICGHNAIFPLEPPVAATDMATNTDTDGVFDQKARIWAKNVTKEYHATVASQRNALASNVICLQSTEHAGPGGAKYWAFRLAQARAKANDVVVVLDGDDEFNTPKALQIINRKYLEMSAWMTYGSYRGKYSEQTKAIPVKYFEGQEIWDPRQDKPSWRFGHARTFKAHLLRHIGRKDFTFKDGSWLIKATDRGFVYRMLEVCGLDRVSFIPEAIYKYKWSATSSTVAQVPKEVRVAQLEHVVSLQPSKRVRLPIHVIIVCWGRVFMLKHQLVWLQHQDLAHNREIIIHLLGNNNETTPEIRQTVQNFQKKQQDNEFQGYVPVQIKLVENDVNWHAFSRFIYTEELRKTEALDFVVFVDDDQYWRPNFISSLLTYHKPRGMTTWYGKTFPNSDQVTGKPDYWTSGIRWSQIMRGELELNSFTYGGPGGSVFDANLWLFGNQLMRLKGDLKQYYEFDDLWASYIIDGMLGWELRRLPSPVPIDIANCDHYIYNETIFPSLPNETALQLRNMHVDMKERLKAVATFSDNSAANTKSAMFNDLFAQFHWDVNRPDGRPWERNKLALERSNMIDVSPILRPKPAVSTPKRAFVCITGQFERLELKTKIETFFRPLTRIGYHVDVAFVLTRGHSAFTNDKYILNQKRGGKGPFYKDFSAAVEDLRRESNVTLVSPADEPNGLYDRISVNKLHLQYLVGLYEAQIKQRTFTAQVSRAENHPRIYESYQRCLAYAKQHIGQVAELAAKEDPSTILNPPTLENYYDVYFRMREDVGFESALPKAVFERIAAPPPNSITACSCRGWRGMNDRFASVSPDVAQIYFNRPYEIFSKQEDMADNYVNNPETFLLYSYLTAGIQVYGTTALRRIVRLYSKDNQAAIYADDLKREWCPPQNNHTLALIRNYGWWNY